MRFLVSAGSSRVPFSIRDTVATDTPATLATSFRLVTRPLPTPAPRFCKSVYKLREAEISVNQAPDEKSDTLAGYCILIGRSGSPPSPDLSDLDSPVTCSRAA